jgi:hypothetical protein
MENHIENLELKLYKCVRIHVHGIKAVFHYGPFARADEACVVFEPVTHA